MLEQENVSVITRLKRKGISAEAEKRRLILI
jgi:hypothetical protein